ncbi:Oidioi.mRNA.OKI2018_I69.XSR.g14939.t1.cds [Oikopleura dioica]|uniref:Oidioi.mRNA.OKI2018_I69.XSR.g14939.t1.cds n=1 Tax=Oikopleura dioica TaxID=34765 RepID=A0ABN7SGF2_OIKDI|nr:Oidioi.mRNA.OKI2018_I69.XSR.g14939.t1.cds [Oikopleura dioica]
MKASPIPPPLFSANQISPPNSHDDDENQTASSEASTELSFNISEHGDSNTSYNSLPLFNTQGSLSESTTKPAKTSDIPDNASECSSIDPCTREESYDSLTRDKADPFSFKNPFESSDEE